LWRFISLCIFLKTSGYCALNFACKKKCGALSI
jgi:hypothetical protein